MTSMKAMEYLVDPCSEIFTAAITDLQGQVVDLGEWLQWYAFDVIGAITFSKRFGFMENRQDVNGVIAGLEGGLMYSSVVGQIPWMHSWLLGNKTVNRLLGLITGGAGDPLPIITKVHIPTLLFDRFVVLIRRTDDIGQHRRVRYGSCI